jgi:putative ABC transport system substrate-binding protein
MRRREFVISLGGTAAAWPLAAKAQQDGRVRRVAILMPFPPSDTDIQLRVRTLQQELQRLGCSKGANILFDERWTTDNMELVRANRLISSS